MILLGGECHSLTALLEKVTGRDAVHIILRKYESYDKIVLLFDYEIGKKRWMKIQSSTSSENTLESANKEIMPPLPLL